MPVVNREQTIDPPGPLEDAINFIRTALDNVQNSIISHLSSYLGDIANRINIIPQAIANIIGQINGMVTNVVNAALNRLYYYLDAITSRFQSVAQSISNYFLSGLDRISTITNNVISTISIKLQQILTVISQTLGNVINAITQKFSEALLHIRQAADNVSRTLKETWDSAIANLREIIGHVREAIENKLREILEKIREVLEKIRDSLREIYEKASQYINEHIIDPIRNQFKDAQETIKFKGETLLKAALGEYTSWDAFVSDLKDPAPALGAVGAIFLGLVITIVVAPALSSVLAPAMENLQHLAAEKFRPSLLSPATIADAYYKGLMSKGEAAKELALAGYKDNKINILLEAQRPLPSPGAIQEAYLRGFISEAKHDELLRKHGYTDEDIRLFKALYYILPTPSDLIRMAVKEAFTPEIARKFGQYEDFPEAFAEWAEKIGIKREWAERYWAAHWDLPSVSQGFEMFHRGIISKEELKLLMRALDIMPFWREKLIQLSYEPYARVDIRRMYQLGLLSFEDVVKAYKDLGYDDEKARNLAEFTARYYAPEDKTELDEYRQLSRSIYIEAYKRKIINRDELLKYLQQIGYSPKDSELLASIADAQMQITDMGESPIPRKERTISLILAAYKKGLIKKDEAISLLQSIGYSDDEITWLITVTDFEFISEIKDAYVQAVREKYISRTYDKATAQIMLNRINIQAEEMERLFLLWDVEREAKTRKPTEAQFRAALKAGLISVEEYMEELRGLGYEEKYVEMLTKLALLGRG
jgi:gas vesicle protein